MTQAAQATPNTLFPGRPDYVGPTTGLFGLLHHDMLCEKSDNVIERVEYVKSKKPQREIATRLHNMIALPDEFDAKRNAIGADYRAKRAPIDADYRIKCGALGADYYAKRAPIDADDHAKRAALYADYDAKCAALYAEILAYIRHHIPDCAWDETKRTLIFPEA